MVVIFALADQQGLAKHGRNIHCAVIKREPHPQSLLPHATTNGLTSHLVVVLFRLQVNMHAE